MMPVDGEIENGKPGVSIGLLFAGIGALALAGFYLLRAKPREKEAEKEEVIPRIKIGDVPRAAKTLVHIRKDGRRNVDMLKGAWHKFWFDNANLEKVTDKTTRNGWKSSKYSNKIPLKMLINQKREESGSYRFAVSLVGAMGPHQFMPGTAKQYFKGSPQSVWSGPTSAEKATTYLGRMYGVYTGRRFEMDRDNALIASALAYNWGPGNVNKMINKRGKDMRANLATRSNRTQDYIWGVLKGVVPKDAPIA